MPKLTRYLQKIFANNSNEVGVFGTGADKETSKNIETLQSADYENGWSSAIITNKNYPIWQEMDGVQYGLSYQLKYLFQNGIPEWLSTETYYTNSYCRVGSTIYYSLQDNNTNHNPALNDGYWTPLLTSNRSIGEIISSTIPLTEAGLHLLDGTLISSGMYAEFVTYMANLTATAPDCFCTEQEWQAAVTANGVCGKFVYDSVNNTVRLPKYSNKIWTQGLSGTAPVVGNGMTLGVTDGTNNAGIAQTSASGIASYLTSYGANVGSTFSGNHLGNLAIGVTTDADKSGLIAQLSDITTSLDGYYYIVIATSTKTDIEVDIDEIATDLNGKADIDLSNVPTSKGILEESYINGTSWYRTYSDGWCEQGGTITNISGTSISVNFVKNYQSTSYTALLQRVENVTTAHYEAHIISKTTSGMTIYPNAQTGLEIDWYTCGYIN